MVLDPVFRYPKRVSKMRAPGSGFWLQNGPQNELKAEKHDRKPLSTSDIVFSSICDRLGSRKWKPRTPLIPLKLFVFLHQNENPLFRPEAVFVSILVPAWLHFGTILKWKWVKKTRKSRPSPLLKTTVFLNGFLIDFLISLVPERGGSSMPWTPPLAQKSVSAPRLGHWGFILTILSPFWTHYHRLGSQFGSLGTHFGNILWIRNTLFDINSRFRWRNQIPCCCCCCCCCCCRCCWYCCCFCFCCFRFVVVDQLQEKHGGGHCAAAQLDIYIYIYIYINK